MRRDPLVFIRHMQQCLARIADYTRAGRAAFLDDTRTQDAVIRNLEIIGQATRDLGIDILQAQAPEIPWRLVADFRNVLAHQYLGVDLRLVWNVVEKELPKLDQALHRMACHSTPETP